MFHLEPRRDNSAWTSVRSVLIALLITTLTSVLVMLMMSDRPAEAIWQLLTFPWQGRRMEVQLGLVAQQAAYLATIAIGLSVGFRANVWNIGAEGQFAVGSIGAYTGYLLLGSPESIWALPLILIAGALGGCLWAMIPAVLRIKFNTNELLTSLMLVYVASHILTYLCICLLYTSPSPRDATLSRMPSSA